MDTRSKTTSSHRAQVNRGGDLAYPPIREIFGSASTDVSCRARAQSNDAQALEWRFFGRGHPNFNAPLAIEEAHIELETVAVHPDTGVPLVLEC